MGGHQARTVSSTADLLSAATDGSVREIRVTGPLASVPTLALRRAKPWSAKARRAACVRSIDGVQLSRDNAVKARCALTQPSAHSRDIGGRFDITPVSTKGPERSHLLWVDLVELGVVEQQTAPLRQAGDVAIAMLPADVVS